LLPESASTKSALAPRLDTLRINRAGHEAVEPELLSRQYITDRDANTPCTNVVLEELEEQAHHQIVRLTSSGSKRQVYEGRDAGDTMYDENDMDNDSASSATTTAALRITSVLTRLLGDVKQRLKGMPGSCADVGPSVGFT
jgi:hypothetical protein